jgi:hypothetical protein
MSMVKIDCLVTFAALYTQVVQTWDEIVGLNLPDDSIKGIKMINGPYIN